MRLWHYKLIPYLPKSQLLAQWRELNGIFKKQDNHILINYVYEYDIRHLKKYTQMILQEMSKRNIKINSYDNFITYCLRKEFDFVMESADLGEISYPFSDHHNDRYLLQCFYNLQEKYDRGQKDFTKENYKKLEEFIKNETSNRDRS